MWSEGRPLFCVCYKMWILSRLDEDHFHIVAFNVSFQFLPTQ